jgi:uncharacterized Ntn-hydrolase superfamily protein
VHVVDRTGRTAVWTGAETIAWAGAERFADFSVAGNMLAGAAVLAAMIEAFRAGVDRPLAHRFMDVLRAGEAAGGDKRGRQSAAMRIVEDQPYPALDLRVDDDADPVGRLQHLLDIYESPEMARQREFRPTVQDPGRVLPASG